MPRRLFHAAPKIQLCLSLFPITLTLFFVQVQAILSPRFRRGERLRTETSTPKLPLHRPDILVRGGGTFWCEVTLSPQVQPLYARNAKTAPICILPKWGFPKWGLLNRRAPSSPMAMPPCGGVRTSLRSGYSGGLSPTPQTPQRRPQRASAQGLRPRFAQLSAPKGLCPFRLRFHRQALVLARASLRSSAAMESPPCGHESAA